MEVLKLTEEFLYENQTTLQFLKLNGRNLSDLTSYDCGDLLR
jgi:hypothetical protein